MMWWMLLYLRKHLYYTWIRADTSLRDVDDDVRTVAASALTPITDILATGLSHEELCSVVDTLWDCLAEGGDDLGSSTGAVMDLLGAMIAHPSVMEVMSEIDSTG